MSRSTATSTLGLLLGLVLAPAAYAQGAPPAITEAEAHAIGVDAYVYFYSLVTMDVTRKQFTNFEPGKVPGRGPMNMFNNVPAYPPADDRGVVRPNFDTLYSVAYLDMTKEPVVVSVPDTNGRYLSAADARHVVGCLRLARLAHDRNASRQLPGHPARLAARPARAVRRGVQAAERHPAHRRADADRLGHRPHQDRRPAGLRCGPQDPGRLQGHAAVRVGQDRRSRRR